MSRPSLPNVLLIIEFPCVVYPKRGQPGGATPSQSSNDPEESLDYGNQPEGLLEYIPIRFLENRIQSLSQTSVPHDLGRLRQHKENMERMRENREWDKLHSEQMNASRTVQVSRTKEE